MLTLVGDDAQVVTVMTYHALALPMAHPSVQSPQMNAAHSIHRCVVHNGAQLQFATLLARKPG